MKQIKFLGAAGEVTGSNYLLTTNSGKEFLVDFGLFQGTEDIVQQNYTPLAFNPFDIDAVFLTHAHLDHCGRLPLLVQHGFRGNIFMTSASKDIVELQLRDSARIALKDKTKKGLFNDRDVDRTLSLIRTTEYNQKVDLPGLSATFKDAGHILGSASIELYDLEAQKKIVFSGDLGNSPSDLLAPTQLIDSSDIVVMETTYGDRNHPTDDPAAIIQSEINEIEKNGGTLLIPAFSLDRTQQLLHILNHLKADGKIANQTDVYLDSPLAIHVTKIYKRYPNLYSQELLAHSKKEDPFSFPKLHIVEKGWESQKIVENTAPKVIIAGNGMMEGGRIMSHAITFLPLPTTRLLIVGYQGEETLGREIQEGAKSVVIDGLTVTVAATITDASALSAHADQKALLQWIKHIQGVKKLFLTHGDESSRTAFSELVKKEVGITDITSPHLLEEVELG